jgi:hypothetical protein
MTSESPTRSRTRWLTGAAALCALAFVAAEVRSAEPQDALLPIPGLLRPKPRKISPEQLSRLKTRGGCESAPLPTVSDQLPFGPGEMLSYNVHALGLQTGRVWLRVGERQEMDSEPVYPLQAQAKTSGLVSVLGSLDGRMLSYVSPDDAQPVRMVNRFITESLLSPKRLAREDAAFSPDAQVAGRLHYRVGDDVSTRPVKLKATGDDLVDVLSVIYYMRSRAMNAGDRYCFEIYHRRRLWRVEGQVGGTKMIRSPFATRRARQIAGVIELVGARPGQEPRGVVAWVSDDDDRLPLLVETPDRFGKLDVRLATWIPGRKLKRGP